MKIDYKFWDLCHNNDAKQQGLDKEIQTPAIKGGREHRHKTIH